MTEQEYKIKIFVLVTAINKSQEELDKLDFKTNKWVEGKLTQDEWDKVVARRDELRAEINAKRAEIEALKGGASQ